MSSIEQIRNAIMTSIRNEISLSNIVSNIETGIKLSRGDSFAILTVISKSIEHGGNITNLLFYYKLREFLINIDEIPLQDRIKFLAKHMNNKEEELSKKLVEEIDSISDSEKIKFISNAFRSLVYDKIDLDLFYRIIGIIRNSLYQDLIYLRDNIKRKKLEPTIEVIALSNLGLMFMSSISNNKEQNKYDFIQLASRIVDYAILGEEVSDRYLGKEEILQVTKVPGQGFSEKQW